MFCFPDDFNVEYLEQEYITRFEDELIQPALPKPVKVPTKPSVAVKAKPKNQKRRASASPIGSAQKRKYPFECAECTKGFLHREIYEAHMRSVHQGLPAFSCPHCPKTFNEKPNYDYHMQDHNNHRPAQCTLCDKSFKNKQDLNSHLRVHNDVRKYMCDVCGMYWSSVDRILMRHCISKCILLFSFLFVYSCRQAISISESYGLSSVFTF